MEFGVHLPLIDFGEGTPSLSKLRDYTRAASDLGYSHLCANDHLLFGRPWLDGPAALASVIDASREMTLATTVALPVVRHPVALAKSLGAIDLLSGGRLVAGLGPGSSARDYQAVGLDFGERWKRLDEAVRALRALWRADGEPFVGRYYSTEGVTLEPRPATPGGPPIWLGSWGSAVGLRRVAGLADGWLASGYNTVPEQFGANREALAGHLRAAGRDASAFPNGIATMWTYVSDDAAEAERLLTEVLPPALGRDPDVLREQLPVGTPEACAERLVRYVAAGAQRIFLWPLAAPRAQIERFRERVVPLVQQAETGATGG